MVQAGPGEWFFHWNLGRKQMLALAVEGVFDTECICAAPPGR